MTRLDKEKFIEVRIGGRITPTVLKASADGDALFRVINEVIDTIDTDIKVTLGEITVTLAMLKDPDHWESDWSELGIEGISGVDEFLQGLITYT